MKEFLYLTTPIDMTVVYRGYPFENKLYDSKPGSKTAVNNYDSKTPVAK